MGPKELRAASPCRAEWLTMRGDGRSRRCLLCGRDVYRAPPAGEVAYRRADGTFLSSDCPVGVRALKLRLARLAGMMAALLASAGGGFWERTFASVFSLH